MIYENKTPQPLGPSLIYICNQSLKPTPTIFLGYQHPPPPNPVTLAV